MNRTWPRFHGNVGALFEQEGQADRCGGTFRSLVNNTPMMQATYSGTALGKPDSCPSRIRIGTAGWSIPHSIAPQFSGEGSGLARYSSRFDAVEINSSFYRFHKPETYARWARTVPDNFRFSVKLPKLVSHEQSLVGTDAVLGRFLDDAGHLGEKLGPILLQLPGTLAFDATIVDAFLVHLRRRFTGFVACEPRHPSWFRRDATKLLKDMAVARVAADPAVVPEAAMPGADMTLLYFRLHGSPRMYYSRYGSDRVEALAKLIEKEKHAERWCILDNTAEGAAIHDAMILLGRWA
jgi:uncharacterized protein YecE (DUF72 family)